MQFNPVPVALSELLTSVIQEFAEKHSLVALPYYHDLPIWILHDSGTRQLQLTVDEKLFFIASAGDRVLPIQQLRLDCSRENIYDAVEETWGRI